MVRASCCEKMGLKKGPWTPEEDHILISHIQRYGHNNWRALPKQAGLLRCGKSCRLRWTNYLRPDIKRGNFTREEEDTIIRLHRQLGNRWSAIAATLPGRTDNEIKNVWHTHLKKRLMIIKDDHRIRADQAETSNRSLTNSISSSSAAETTTASLAAACSSTEATSIAAGDQYSSANDAYVDFSKEFDLDIDDYLWSDAFLDLDDNKLVSRITSPADSSSLDEQYFNNFSSPSLDRNNIGMEFCLEMLVRNGDHFPNDLLEF